MDTALQQEAQFEILDMAHICASASNATYRHIACTPCRQSKVRCDGEKPRCKRCGSGQSPWQCSYPSASSKRGRPRKQPKAALSSSSRTSSPSNTSCKSAGVLGWEDGGCDSNSLWPKVSIPLSPNCDDPASITRANGNSTCLWDLEIGSGDTKMHGFDTDLLVDVAPSNCLPRGLTETLLSEYYTSSQQNFRLFEEREELLSLLDQSNQEAMALKYAACAHALTLRVRSQHPPGPGRRTSVFQTSVANNSEDDHASLFYRLARTSLHQSDTGQKTFITMLQTLQATILTGLYELQQAEFSCAWLSVSRAIWLTEELQLHSLDTEGCSPMTYDEQRMGRRALWATNGLSSFLSIILRNLGNAQSVAKLITSLPTDKNCPNSGVTVTEVYQGTCARLLSMEEGLCAVRCLTTRVLSHASHGKNSNDTALNPQPYNFWTQHSQLEESLNNLQLLTEQWLPTPSLGSPNPATTLTLLGMHTKALSIILGEAKLTRLHMNPVFGFDQVQIRFCEEAVYQSCLELVSALENMEKILPADSATNTTLSWVVFVTLQCLLRQRHRQRKLASWPIFDDFPVFSLSRNSSLSSDGAKMCPDLNQELLTEIATPPSSTSSTSGFSWTSTSTNLTEALVLDAFEALQSGLANCAAKVPIASVFSKQLEMEINCSTEALQVRVVGLTGSGGRAL